ncbi:Rec8 like protein-domain-containing protein [Armillaria nabsnona]|nr:Rec8 like protein-domain-containing protein [Armillaria nabsnona]
MFYSEAILSRRGPLGKVWLAAHMERKLSKTQTLQTDIEESVGAIMGQEIEIMALRLSGQLLLGVVRIYSRKAKYLLDDCNEALLKIKMAFRPGIVDMNEDQLVANKTTITLASNDLDLNLYIPDVNWDMDFEDRPLPQQGHQHQARVDDITLRNTEDFGQFDYNDPLDLGPSDGIGSQDFDIDLGLDWGDGAVNNDSMDVDALSVDGSVGVGRDAAPGRDSIGIDAHLLGGDVDMDMDIDLLRRSKSREASEHPFDADMNIDVPDFGDVDLGDLGIGFDLPNDLPSDLPQDGEKTPGQTRSSSRASSPLSDVPLTPPPIEMNGDVTPIAPTKAQRKHKEKKQIIDAVTELQGGPGNGRGRHGLGAPVNKDVSDILVEPHFLPRSSVVMRLLEIRSDPLAHFLPTKVTPQGTILCAAPPGLAPELAEMFMRPITGSKKRGLSPGKGPNKRRKVDEASVHEDDEVEQGRRAESLAPSVILGSDVMGRGVSVGPDGLDFGDQTGGAEDFQLDVPDLDVDIGLDVREKSAAPSDRSRMSTPAGDLLEEGADSYADLTSPIAMFDIRPSTQTQEKEAEPMDTEGKGYSKNTVKALGIIRRELKPGEDDDAEEKVISFRKMADKASRRAAASFFFELLVLGTRDCVKLSQPGPFENIEVRAQDKLWERQRHGSVEPSVRGASVARSIASTMGL